MQSRPLGPFTVSAIGLGCMNLSHAYGTPPPREDAQKLLLRALDLGVTLFDTAALYGFGLNEELLGDTLRAHRSKFTLASKGGLHGSPEGQRVMDGRPETLKWSCEQSLRRLKTDVIDLYYLHRWDKRVPIEDSVGAMSDLVREGKVRTLGLSEVGAAAIRRAHAVHPIVAVQTEYSLWTRNAEIAVLDACQEIGAAFVAFSPVARGFLCGGLRDVTSLGERDIRKTMPRFSPQNYAANLKLLDQLTLLGQGIGATPAQMALGWLLHKAPHVIPIPGTRSVAHLEEDLKADELTLSDEMMGKLGVLFAPNAVSGPRYEPAAQASVDTENF